MSDMRGMTPERISATEMAVERLGGTTEGTAADLSNFR